jgi:hypothetical protein
MGGRRVDAPAPVGRKLCTAAPMAWSPLRWPAWADSVTCYRLGRSGSLRGRSGPAPLELLCVDRYLLLRAGRGGANSAFEGIWTDGPVAVGRVHATSTISGHAGTMAGAGQTESTFDWRLPRRLFDDQRETRDFRCARLVVWPVWGLPHLLQTALPDRWDRRCADLSMPAQ